MPLIIRKLHIHYPGLQVHKTDMVAVNRIIVDLGKRLEVGQEVKGDKRPQFLAQLILSFPDNIGRIRQILFVLFIIKSGIKGVEHSVIGPHINYLPPVPVIIIECPVGIIPVNQIQRLGRFAHNSGG